MTRIAWVFTLLFAIFGAPLLAQGPDEIPDEPVEELIEDRPSKLREKRESEFRESLNPQSGEVKIDVAKVTLHLGEDYVFYGPKDTKTILMQFIGEYSALSAPDVLGMVVPAGSSPMSASWRAMISYENTGYVSDEDAQDTDYDALMEFFQERAIKSENAILRAGFSGVEIVGWAETPKYDAANHTLIWAQYLKFFGKEDDSLNYNLHMLGRRGVLSMNLVSNEPDLDGVRSTSSALAAHVEFDEGARYQEFDSTTDRVAEYGVGGFVPTLVNVAEEEKSGNPLNLFLLFKLFMLGIFAFFAAFRKRVFGSFYDDEDEEDDWDDGYSYNEIAEDEDVPEVSETKSNVPTIDGKPFDY